MAAPLSVEALAAPVDSPTFAAEMYLAAATVLNSSRPGDSEWLASFAKALELDAQLAEDLLKGLG